MVSPQAQRHPGLVPAPLEETEDGFTKMHHAINEATGYYGFGVAVPALTDMERNEHME